MKKIFKITNQTSDQRLDKFLTEHWPEYSRAYLKSQIKSGRVKISDEIKKPSYILKNDDIVEAEILPPPEISLEPDAAIKLNIVYEDDNVMVVDKPAGLTVHPSDTQKSGTLVNALLAHYPLLKEVGDDPLRPGLVHRLDKDTSGLMIIAKNNSAFSWLKKQFQERKVEKKYLALVVDKPKELNGIIKTYFTRSKSDPTKQKVSIKPTDREAITHYRTIREFKDFTLLEAHPKTGRMHQIRVHLAWLGCPIVGDTKYGKRGQIPPAGLVRQFLHAAELTIILPRGKKMTFDSPLPHELADTLKALEKNNA